MAIITISRGCFSHGKEIAEKVAERLGYECISLEILLDAAEFFHVSERRLLKSLHDAPSVLARITQGQSEYLAYIRASLLERVKNDKVVYHGHAGHFLLAGISHVLKVRVIAGMEQRIALLVSQRGIGRKEAMEIIEDEDRQRELWTRYLYNADLTAPHLYDLMLNIERLTISDACEIICKAAVSEGCRTTEASLKAARDLALSAHVAAALHDLCQAEVTADDGAVWVRVRGQKIKKTGVASPKVQDFVKEEIQKGLLIQINEAVRSIPGVKTISCDLAPPYYG